MKSLTVITIVLFVSCSNPKVKIVEQIKAYKDSVMVVREAIYQLDLKERGKYMELFYSNGGLDRNKFDNVKLKAEHSDYQRKTEVEKWNFKFKQGHFERLIDSLELELKKY
jgi:ribosomal protein L14E/L6E/L27E